MVKTATIVSFFCVATVVTDAASSDWQLRGANATLKPSHRLGMTITPLTDADGVMMFAGCSSSCCYDPLDDSWIWTRATGWKQLPQPATGPGGRLYHSLTPVGSGHAVLVGGSSVAQEFLGDVWELDTSGLAAGNAAPSWTKSSASIPPRGGHSAVVASDGSIIVAGGRNLTDVLEDVWLLRRSSAQIVLGGATWEAEELRTSGWGGLVNHAAEMVTLGGRQTLAVVGGTDGLGNDNAAVLLLDLTAKQWTKHTSPLGQRHGAVSWSSGQSSLLVFGGQAGEGESAPYLGDLWRLDLAADGSVTAHLLQNSTYSPSKTQPNAREDAAAVQGGGGGQSWLFGGFSGYGGGLNDRLHNDLWTLAGL